LASETFRVTHATNNKVIRNVIYVQGTETAYEPMNQDFNVADLIGIGNRSLLGGAAGNVHIGTGTSDGFSMTDLIAGWDTTVNNGGGLGISVFNCHFAVAGSYWAVDLEDALESRFEDCTFLNNSTAADGCFRATNNFAANLIRNCHVGGDAGTPVDGFYFTGGVWNENVVEDNWGHVSRYGLYNACYLQGGSVVRNNTFDGGTYGIYDASTGGTGGMYVANYVSGSTAGITVTTNPTKRAIGNWSMSNGTFGWYTAYGGTA
jgi:hypothetical protein